MTETKAKALKQSELAALYKVNVRTFASWLKPFNEKIGERIGLFYTPKQVQTIFDCIGEP